MGARVLTNRLRIVARDLIGAEQNCAVKGGSIQNNQYLMRIILEGVEDDTKDVLINLDRPKAFNKVDQRFCVIIWRPLNSIRSSADGPRYCTAYQR